MNSGLIIKPMVIALSLAAGTLVMAQTNTADPAAVRTQDAQRNTAADPRSKVETAERPAHRRDARHEKYSDDEPLNDDEALHILMEINNHEIEAGRLAESRASDAEVREYAEKMVQEHEANNRMASSLLTSGAQPDAPLTHKLEKMRDKHQEQRAKLEGLSGAGFDRAYIDAMIKGHDKALKKVGDELLPHSQKADNRVHMDETLRTIAEHREHAYRIKAQLR